MSEQRGFVVPGLASAVFGADVVIGSPRKLATVLAVPEELLRDAAPLAEYFTLTGEERATRRAAAKARDERADAAVADAYRRLLDAAAGDPLAVAVLTLHSPKGAECEGDDFGGYEGEAPEWPCATVRLVAERLGVAVPEDLWWNAWRHAGDTCGGGDGGTNDGNHHAEGWRRR